MGEGAIGRDAFESFPETRTLHLFFLTHSEAHLYQMDWASSRRLSKQGGSSAFDPLHARWELLLEKALGEAHVEPHVLELEERLIAIRFDDLLHGGQPELMIHPEVNATIEAAPIWLRSEDQMREAAALDRLLPDEGDLVILGGLSEAVEEIGEEASSRAQRVSIDDAFDCLIDPGLIEQEAVAFDRDDPFLGDIDFDAEGDVSLAFPLHVEDALFGRVFQTELRVELLLAERSAQRLHASHGLRHPLQDRRDGQARIRRSVTARRRRAQKSEHST